MLYDITKPGLLIDSYPEIKKFPPLWQGNEVLHLDGMDKMLRFVLCFFDTDKKYDFATRKIDLFSELKTPKLVRDVIDADSPEFLNLKLYREMVICYFKLINSYDYEEWISKKSLFHFWTSIIRMDVYDKDVIDRQIKISQELPSIKKGIVELEHHLFPDGATASMVARFRIEASFEGYVEKHAQIFDQ